MVILIFNIYMVFWMFNGLFIMIYKLEYEILELLCVTIMLRNDFKSDIYEI